MSSEGQQPRGQGRNSAEHPSWGECIGEMVICDEQGRNGPPGRQWMCTGGTHVGPGQYFRCVSDFHYQDGPMSPGIGFLPLDGFRPLDGES